MLYVTLNTKGTILLDLEFNCQVDCNSTGEKPNCNLRIAFDAHNSEKLHESMT